jgi:hypothetical protein
MRYSPRSCQWAGKFEVSNPVVLWRCMQILFSPHSPHIWGYVGLSVYCFVWEVTENRVWRSCDRASLMYSFKYDQQNAVLYCILYYCQCSTCFRRFLSPSSGAQNCTHSIWYVPGLLAATANSPTLAVAASNLDIYQMLCVQFLAPDNGWRNRLKHVEHWQ